MPYLDRRPIGFYVGWNLGIYVHPIYPTGIKPNARFFPVLLASTFNDYYVYSYSGGGRYRTDRSVSAAGVTLGCMSVIAGTAIALVTVIAWFAAVRALWRRREDGEPDPRFALLLAPLGALIGQIHFATKYPNDNFGPIKGAYLQFVAPSCARCSASASRGCGGGRAGAGAFRRWSRSAASGWSRPIPRTRAFLASARTPTGRRPSSRPRKSEGSIPPVPAPATAQRFFIVGGAGFIGSHFCDHLLGPDGAVDRRDPVRQLHLGPGMALRASRGRRPPRVVRGNAEDTAALAAAMQGHDVVIHLASNPDIARAATEPTIDFSQGTALTQSVVEAMRTTGAKRILYASGSGVYGDLGTREAAEDHGPLVPVSTYGASKLAGEALIASYAAMFGLSGCAFRFGNVVGPRQTHGVGFDFARALLRAVAAGERRSRCASSATARQSKSYIHVDDVVRAVLTAHEKTTAPFAVYNVATGDYITVREIAELAVACVGLAAGQRALRLHGRRPRLEGRRARGPAGHDRIRALGWRCERPSREALRQSIARDDPGHASGADVTSTSATRRSRRRAAVPAADVADPELSIVIPALNEELTIADFVAWCHAGMKAAGVVGEILIVDSGSDRTTELALAGGARVLRTPKRGLGRAYIDALPFIRGRYVLMGDCDCTYDFRELAPFVEKFRGGAEFVMGSRFRGYIEPGSMPPLHRYLGTPVTTAILNVIFGSRFSDIHCGMRGITRDALMRMDLRSQSWEYASEMVLKSVHMRLRTEEVRSASSRTAKGA